MRFASLLFVIFIVPSIVGFRTLLCCCGCTTKPCPEIPSLCPSPTTPCSGQDDGPAIIDCNELQSLWDQAIVESAVESSEKDANMSDVQPPGWMPFVIEDIVNTRENNSIHSLLTSPTADQTIAKMEKLLIDSVEESLIDEDKESIRALMTVLRERMQREKSKEMRVRRSVIDGDSSRFRSPPIMPLKSGHDFRRKKRQSGVVSIHPTVEEKVEGNEGEMKREEGKRDVIEQTTIGDGGASTKVNGGGGKEGGGRGGEGGGGGGEAVKGGESAPHSDVSLVAGADVADGDHSHSSHRGKKEGNCNDLKMRKMITDNIGKTPKDSKKQIQKALERSMGGTFSVVCSPCEFSFVIRSESYCDGFKNQIACFAYRDEDE